MKTYALTCRNHHMQLGFPPCIMGVLNVTPDSFSDGGQFFDTEKAILHAQQMVNQGADMIDIGGESTRPFAEPVNADEEIKRVVPVISELAQKISVPISIDTSKAAVAAAAIEAGASIINDISALNDPQMATVARQASVPIILMHIQGTPQTMQIAPKYTQIIDEIHKHLSNRIQKALDAGIPKNLILVDPGIGFGKTIEDNYIIIQNLHRFHDLDVPLLVGTSRKSFIRKTLESHYPQFTNDPNAIDCGTMVTIIMCALAGAHIVRVHNVHQTRITLTILKSLAGDHISGCLEKSDAS